jgi:hypothetical protein
MPDSPEARRGYSLQQLTAKGLLGRLDELVTLSGSLRTATVASAPAGRTLRSATVAPAPAERASLFAFDQPSNPMDDRVRRALSANHLDPHAAALAALGVETALDLSNPYAASDAQLRLAGLSTLSIRRYRRVGEEMALLLEAEGLLQAIAEEGDDDEADYRLLTEDERRSRASEWRLAHDASRGGSRAREGDTAAPVPGSGGAETDGSGGGGTGSSRASRESRGASRSRARESRASGATLAADAARRAAASFLPLLLELGLEAHEAALLEATGGDKTTRALLLKVPR